MPNLKELLERMKTVSLVQQMTKTMQTISMSKYRVFINLLHSAKSYYDELVDVKKKIMKDDNASAIDEQHRGNVLIIPVSASKGFCGNFNTLICKKTIEVIEDFKNNALCNFAILPIGKMVHDFLIRHNYKCDSSSSALLQKISIDNINHKLSDIVDCGRYDEICVIYNKSVSMAKYGVNVVTMSLNNYQCSAIDDTLFFFDPNWRVCASYLDSLLLKTKLIICFFESCVAEYGSRMTNMGKATDNAEVLFRNLRVSFNQIRQATITNELIEISAGFNNI